MAIEHAALASWMVQAQVVLASLTITKQMALVSRVTKEHTTLASRVTWEQMALASLTVAKHKAWASRVTLEQTALACLMDSVTWDSFWWSSIPSSQMALHLQVSMDALVVSSSLRALLAFLQSSIASARGVMLLDLEVVAMGEMLLGIPSKDASAISALTWDEVSTDWCSSFGLWGGGVRTTIGFASSESRFWTHGQKCSASLKIGDSLPPRSCCPLLPILGVDLWGLAIMVVETSPIGSTFQSSSSAGDGRMSISK